MYKKSFTWIMAWVMTVIATAVSFTACSSDEDMNVPVSQSSEYEELMDALENYSSLFTAEHGMVSRGDLGWGKFKESVKADHLGYNNGSTVLSISASRKKWKELKREELQKQLETYEMAPAERTAIKAQVDSLKSIYKADASNIGAIHNAVILQTLLDDDMDFNTTEELVQSVVGAMNKLDVSVPNLDMQKTVEEVNDFFDTIYDSDITVMYDRLTVKYPERKEEFKILNQYLLTTENLNSVEDIVEFSNGYSKIIDQSKISPSVKTELKSNISIAPASHNLWRTVDVFAK